MPVGLCCDEFVVRMIVSGEWRRAVGQVGITRGFVEI